MSKVYTIEAAVKSVAEEVKRIERETQYKGYCVSDLRKVFDRIADKKDWKGPIYATCPGESVALVVAAIEFFTATVAHVWRNPDTMQYLIESEGYRNGPAGDH
ncbi:MAG: hypothetical protein ACE5HC_16990 [Candidatus Binatia bacterium]